MIFTSVKFNPRYVTIVFLLALFLVSVLSTTASAGTPGEVAVGELLREATLDGLNGKTKTFSYLKGKPLLINIWASWCSPCRDEMSSLERLAKRYNKKAFNVIGISTDDYRNKAIDFIKQTEITFEKFYRPQTLTGKHARCQHYTADNFC